MFDLSGRVAIVTGGSRGIGLSIAHGFAAQGAKVVVASRKADACDLAVAEIAEAGGEALAVPVHMGDLDSVNRLVDATLEHYGQIDIVVNNAANPLGLPMDQIHSRSVGEVVHREPAGAVLLVPAVPAVAFGIRPRLGHQRDLGGGLHPRRQHRHVLGG